MTVVAEKLRKARMDKNLKQTEVAMHLGCAATCLTNWESGKIKPPLEKLEQLCSLYEIHPLWLLDKACTMDDVIAALRKPLSERSYEESVLLAFCGDLIIPASVPDNSESELLAIYYAMSTEMKKAFLHIGATLANIR